MTAIAVLVLVVTATSTLLFLWNLVYYVPPEKAGLSSTPAVSLLIPARDEEQSIEAALGAALASRGVELEVIVADDQSADRTAEIVTRIGQRDPRVRLISVPPLPPGWCGKQFACHWLSQHARHKTLCFVDADVRLSQDGLARMAATLQSSRAALLSGFPEQETDSWLEHLMIPLMHFLLLAYLPMIGMKKTNQIAYGAGCGQLFVADADAYRRVGGHAAIKSSRHDGITLPREFRRAGFMTDVCDATAVAKCRMYRSGGEVLRGLLKNATEGLASRSRILPFTFLLFAGQVCPALLLGYSMLHGASNFVVTSAIATVVMSYLPRLIAVWKFEQPLWGALLHPAAILILLAVQWYAFLLDAAGVPKVWKGRRYSTT